MPKRIQMPCYHSFFLYLVMFFMQLQGYISQPLTCQVFFGFFPIIQKRGIPTAGFNLLRGKTTHFAVTSIGKLRRMISITSDRVSTVTSLSGAGACAPTPLLSHTVHAPAFLPD